MTEPTIAELREAIGRLLPVACAATEIDHLSFVIESAVRNADPGHSEAVTKALIAIRAGVAKATGA